MAGERRVDPFERLDDHVTQDGCLLTIAVQMPELVRSAVCFAKDGEKEVPRLRREKMLRDVGLWSRLASTSVRRSRS